MLDTALVSLGALGSYKGLAMYVQNYTIFTLDLMYNFCLRGKNIRYEFSGLMERRFF